MVYSAEKLDQWNILCTSEEDRMKWLESFTEGLKNVPTEMSRDYERMNKRLSLKKGVSSKKSKRLTRTDVNRF